MPSSDPQPVRTAPVSGLQLKTVLSIALVLIVIFGLAWWLWPIFAPLMRDEQALRRAVDGLGWFGPLALIALNTLQIVVAPIPGYVIQAAAGLLYGPIWGGVWATCGLMSGAMLAMWLARRFGRPLAARMVGQLRIDQWESATHSTHPLIWFVMLLAPIGDIPYFLAGLSKVGFLPIALLTLIVRAPTVFAWAAIGAGTVTLTWWQLTLILAVLGFLMLLFLRYQQSMLAWVDRFVRQQTSASQ